MYYLHFNNAQYGPYTEEQVKGMVAAGSIPNSALVYDQNRSNQWQPLHNFPHLMRPPGRQAQNLATNPSLSSIPIASSDIERTIWEGHPSNLTVLGTYLKYLLMVIISMVIYEVSRKNIQEYQTYIGYAVASLCAFIFLKAVWLWIVLKCTKWVLTTDRFTYSIGVFSRRTENLELYRIKDFSLRVPFLVRIFGYGFVDLISSDKTDPKIPCIGAIKNPKNLYEMVRKYTERQRKRHGVREFDIG